MASQTRFPTASQNVTVSGTALAQGPWSNIGNVFSTDGAVATYPSGGFFSNYLRTYTYGFSIPVGSVIDGIVVTAICSDNGGATPASNDLSIKLFKGGTQGGEDKAQGVRWQGTLTWGGSTDLWMQSFTAADINDVAFGSGIAASTGGIVSPEAYTDSVSMTVYYTPPTQTRTHTTSSYLRTAFYRTHTANALLKRVVSKTHTTSSRLILGGQRLHNTDALLVGRYIVSHTSNSIKKKRVLLSHTTQAFKRRIDDSQHPLGLRDARQT
jgi:hypothetical protein